MGLDFQPFRRLLERLFGKIKRAPVHGQKPLRANVGEDLEGLFGCAMDEPHHIRREIGADRDGGKIEGAQPLPDVLEKWGVVAGIAGEEKLLVSPADGPAAP